MAPATIAGDNDRFLCHITYDGSSGPDWFGAHTLGACLRFVGKSIRIYEIGDNGHMTLRGIHRNARVDGFGHMDWNAGR